MRWADSIRVPWAVLAFGAVLGWALAGFVALWLVKVPDFDARVRVDVAGTVVAVEVVDVGAQRALDLIVKGQPVRLRVQPAVFAGALGGRVPQPLVVGASVLARVPKTELDAPYRPAPLQAPTATADALKADGRVVLSLTAARAWAGSNRRIAQVLCPIFAVMAAVLTAAAVAKRRRG